MTLLARLLYHLFAVITLVSVAVAAFSLSAFGQTVESGSMPMKLLLKTEGATVAITLSDNPTARDLFDQLPLSLDLSDYAGTEKIATLPRKLTTREAPQGSDPEIGTLAYYAPWGNLALFYNDFGYSRGLITLGVVDADAVAKLARLPNGKVALERGE